LKGQGYPAFRRSWIVDSTDALTVDSQSIGMPDYTWLWLTDVAGRPLCSAHRGLPFSIGRHQRHAGESLN
jgi:hypothetical protein